MLTLLEPFRSVRLGEPTVVIKTGDLTGTRSWLEPDPSVAGARWVPLPAPVHAIAMVLDRDETIDRVGIVFTHKLENGDSADMRGSDASGTLTFTVHMNAEFTAGKLSLTSSFDQLVSARRLLPAIQWLTELLPGRAISVTLADPRSLGLVDAALVTTKQLPARPSLVEPALLLTIQMIARLGHLLGRELAVPRVMSPEEGVDLERAVCLLEGETLQVPWESLRLGLEGVTEAEYESNGLALGGPGGMIHVESYFEISLGSRKIGIGEVVYRTRARRSSGGPATELRLVPFAAGEPLVIALLSSASENRATDPSGVTPRRRFALTGAGRGGNPGVSSNFDSYLEAARKSGSG